MPSFSRLFLCLSFILACSYGSLESQNLNLQYDDMGNPIFPNIVYLEVENAQNLGVLQAKHVEAAVGNAINRIGNVGQVSSLKGLDWARSKYSRDPYKHLKDGGRHYMIRIIANEYREIKEKFRKPTTDELVVREVTRYLDLSLYIISVATSKVVKVVNLRAESYPYIKRAQGQKKKNPRTNVPQYALYESLDAGVKSELGKFFSTFQPINELIKETNKKVEQFNLKFIGKTNKDIISKADIIVVQRVVDTPRGAFKVLKKIGTAAYLASASQRGLPAYYVKTGKRALKKALQNQQPVYLTRQGKSL